MEPPNIPPTPPIFAGRALSNGQKQLTGFYVNLGAIRIQITFSVPVNVPDDFGYNLNIEASSQFNIIQN